MENEKIMNISMEDETQISLTLDNKKAVLSQRWPRNAPYTWVPWNFRDSL